MARRFTALETARLALRAMRPEDAPAVHAYMSDPVVTRWLPEGLLDEAQAQAFVRRNAGRSARAVALVECSAGRLVGHMVFHPWLGHAKHAIGWVVSAHRQGQGRPLCRGRSTSRRCPARQGRSA